MSRKTWKLTDIPHGCHRLDSPITPKELSGSVSEWKITQQLLHGGLSEGVELVELDNGRMRVYVIPTRGMGIWRAELHDGQQLGWNSPVRGPVHPSFVPIAEPSGLGWIDGFDELVVRCGLESNGAPDFDEEGKLTYPLHGRIANRPAHHVEVTVDDSARTITLEGVVEEARFHFQKLRMKSSITTSFDSTSFSIKDEIENFGGAPAEMQMLYHINIGDPILGEGAQLVAPVRKVEPRDPPTSGYPWNIYGPPVAGAEEEVYLFELLANETGQTQVLLKNSDGTAGTTLRYNKNSLPYFTQWKNMVAQEDGYVTGIEPATNYPYARSKETEAGRVVKLAAGEKWSAEVVVDWLTSPAEVKVAEEAIDKLQD